MAYGPRQRCPKGRTSEPRSRAAAGIRADAGRRRAAVTRVFHFSSAGLSIPSAGLRVKAAHRGERIEAGVYSQAAAQFDPAGAVVRICQASLDQRGREPSEVTISDPCSRETSRSGPRRLPMSGRRLCRLAVLVRQMNRPDRTKSGAVS